MTDRWTQLRTLFDEVVELRDADRHARLRDIGGRDAPMRARLEAMLSADAADAAAEGPLRSYEQLVARSVLAATARHTAATGPRTETDPLGLLGTTVRRYRVDALLGAGGMGVVYRATDLRLGRVGALKFLPPVWSLDTRAKERFLHEARAASSLDHPNVCTIYEADETADGTLYIAMAFYEGETLRARLERGPLELDEALDLATQAARGLAAAHGQGLVHRDIKPANLLVTPEGTLKILDFGVAKAADVGLTLTEQRPGTAAYMAPEQAQGEAVDGRADLWSLGVVLYELLTGMRPAGVGHGGAQVEPASRMRAELPASRRRTRLPPSSVRKAVPESVDALAVSLLAHDPEDRPARADDVVRALEHILEHAKTASTGTTAQAPSRGGFLKELSLADSGPATPIPVTALPPGNLPVSLSSFVGREQELQDLPPLVGRRRLVTLTGPGGCGKTRLAIEVARRSVDEFTDGVFLVELAPIADPAVVPRELARALDVREAPGERPADAVGRRIGKDRLLLVLDNCEHVIDAAAELAEKLLVACPRLTVFATSREPLRVTGEQIRRVPPLGVPDPTAPARLVELLAYDAVRLFVDRATAADSDFVLDETNAADVVLACYRLDGFPLAVELAAARVPLFSVRGIVERLDDRFRLLAGGARTALVRQQTLQATVDWSYDLLTGDQRTVFCRLSVFHDGFDLEAAEAVCGGSGIDPGGVAVLVGELVERSMVVADRTGAAVRYRLLETMREYGTSRLRERGVLDAARDRHNQWAAHLVERAAPELAGGVRHEWLARLDAHRDDLRAVFDRLVGRPARDSGAPRMAGLLWPYWLWYGYLGEGTQRCEAALARVPAPSLDRVEALLGAHALAVRWAGLLRSRRYLTDALAEADAVGDDRGICRALWFDGVYHYLHDNYETAERGFKAAHVRARAAGLRAEEVSAVHALAVVAWAQRRFDLCQAFLEEARAGARTLVDRGGGLLMLTLAPMAPTFRSGELRLMWEETWVPFQETSGGSAEAYVLANMGNMARGMGRFHEARARLEEALAIYESAGDQAGAGLAHCRLGQVALATGDFEPAGRHLRRSLRIRERIGDARGVEVSLMNLGHLATQEGELAAARELLGRAEKLCRQRRDRPALGAILGRKGVLHMVEGDMAAAASRFREAVETQRGLGVNLVTAAALTDLADAYARTGRTGDAAAAAGEALELFEQNGYDDEAGRCRQLLANTSKTPAGKGG